MSIQRIKRALAKLAGVFAVAAGCLGAGAAAAADLVDVRFGVHSPTATRIVFDLSGPAAYRISGDSDGEGRLIIDFEGLSAAPAQQQPRKGAGHVARASVAAAGSGARAVIDFAKTAKVKEHFILPAKAAGENTRLVIDLETAEMAAFLTSLPRQYDDLASVIEAATGDGTGDGEEDAAPPPPEQPSEKPAPAPAVASVSPIIVIDPGHGGRDPGSLGQGGTLEKTVALAAARELAERLETIGRYRVVLLRDDDVYIDLEDRSRAARKAGADLFISLHADAHTNHSLRGGSVYTLSEEGSARSAREARTSGDYNVYALDLNEFTPDVSSILFDKAQATTRNASSDFADLLIANLQGVTPLVNNSHRTADLFVLLAPDVPAVLLELAFISNKQDEANLTSPAWRAKTMHAVAETIDRYFQAKTPIRQAARGANSGN